MACDDTHTHIKQISKFSSENCKWYPSFSSWIRWICAPNCPVSTPLDSHHISPIKPRVIGPLEWLQYSVFDRKCHISSRTPFILIMCSLDLCPTRTSYGLWFHSLTMRSLFPLSVVYKMTLAWIKSNGISWRHMHYGYTFRVKIQGSPKALFMTFQCVFMLLLEPPCTLADLRWGSRCRLEKTNE